MNIDLLRQYVYRMFLQKSFFVEAMKLKTGISLPKSYTFKALIERVHSQLGEGNFLEVLALDSENEAIEKIDLIPLLVSLERGDLLDLSERLTIHVNRKMNRGDLTRAILSRSKLANLMPVLKELAKEKFIVAVNYEGRVIGPLGITDLKSNEDLGAAHAFIQLFRYMDTKLINNIAVEVKMQEPSPAETAQRILSEIGVSKILQVLSNMILSSKADVNKLTVPTSMRVDRRYGILYPIETPVERLAMFLCDQFSEKDLERNLKSGYKSFREKVLAYCIRDNPFDIIENLMGEPQLRASLISVFGIDEPLLPSMKGELINMILFHMGFFIPKSPSGLATYTDKVKRLRHTLERPTSTETIVGSVTSAFVETEGLLKDIIFFYGAHIEHREGYPLQKREGYITVLEREILTTSYGKKVTIDSIQRTNFGKLVEILRLMEKKVRETSELSSKMQDTFGRSTLLDPQGQVARLLDDLSSYRKFYVHDTQEQASKKIENAIFVLDLMKKLAEALKGIYPMAVFGSKIIYDNFGKNYLVAEDDQNEEYTIYLNEYISNEVLQHEYLVKDSSSPIIINPLIVFKP